MKRPAPRSAFCWPYMPVTSANRAIMIRVLGMFSGAAMAGLEIRRD